MKNLKPNIRKVFCYQYILPSQFSSVIFLFKKAETHSHFHFSFRRVPVFLPISCPVVPKSCYLEWCVKCIIQV